MATMRDQYYTASDNIWDSWSESKMRKFLIENDLAQKSDVADLKRHELENNLASNYYKAKTVLHSNWSEKQMRDWLINNGYMKSDAQATKDEVFDTFRNKYTAKPSASSYLSWSDARSECCAVSRWVFANLVQFADGCARTTSRPTTCPTIVMSSLH